jgi:hypothetical protein
MVWLNDISPWTLAAVGLGWFGVSGMFALVLGKVLARTNAAAENEERALQRAEHALGFKPEARLQHQATDDFFAGHVDAGDESVYTGRAASGTHFKAVLAEGEQRGEEQEAASGLGNVRQLRRAR